VIPTAGDAIVDVAANALRSHRAVPLAELAHDVTVAVLRATAARLGAAPSARKLQGWIDQLQQPGPVALQLPGVTDGHGDGVLQVDVEELHRQRVTYRARVAVIDAMLGPDEPASIVAVGDRQWAVRINPLDPADGPARLWRDNGTEILDQTTALRVFVGLGGAAGRGDAGVALVTRIAAVLHDGTEVTTGWQPVQPSWPAPARTGRGA
jgi:hypothetical protein